MGSGHAVGLRLIEIGEAVEGLPRELLAKEPAPPWSQIAAIRDRLAHHDFDTSHAIAGATAERDLPDLQQPVQRLTDSIAEQQRRVGGGHGSRTKRDEMCPSLPRQWCHRWSSTVSCGAGRRRAEGGRLGGGPAAPVRWW